MPKSERKIFTNQSLSMKKIKAIGYDMDYTLIHYHTELWEELAYNTIVEYLKKHHMSMPKTKFDPELVIRGLIIDRKYGNILKVCQYGQVKLAYHGTSALSPKRIGQLYSKEIVHLSTDRFVFLNTLFSGSIGCLYTQLVDAHDHGQLASYDYDTLYELLDEATAYTHLESHLKSEIIKNPSKYVFKDDDMILTLKEQIACGKKLFLVTNSDWDYTQSIMSHVFDPYLDGESWESLFNVIVVGARKPAFFSSSQETFCVDRETSLLKPVGRKLPSGQVYYRCNAQEVESLLKVSGNDIIYVGDHMYTDINVSKRVFGWRTCLIIRELEKEINTIIINKESIKRLISMRRERHTIDKIMSRLEMDQITQKESFEKDQAEHLASLKKQYKKIDAQIIEEEKKYNQLSNKTWGLLMRSGQQKSHLARQVERYADIYTSRVSNFHFYSPSCHFDYISRPLPHDTNITR